MHHASPNKSNAEEDTSAHSNVSEAVLPALPAVPAASDAVTPISNDQAETAPPRTVKLELANILELFFRIGFSSIFLVNAIYAAVSPKDFKALLVANPLTNAIGFTDTMVKVAMVNDLLLGLLVLWGWRKPWVYAWAGAWLVIVAGIKLVNLFV